jgi:hypothetical protein
MSVTYLLVVCYAYFWVKKCISCIRGASHDFSVFTFPSICIQLYIPASKQNLIKTKPKALTEYLSRTERSGRGHGIVQIMFFFQKPELEFDQSPLQILQ